MKFKNERLIKRFNNKANDFVMNTLCYPFNKVEKAVLNYRKRLKNNSHPNIYQWL